MTTLGIIDLGSNSARLILYETLPNGSYRPTFEMKQNIRLAEAMVDGRISDEGVERAITCSTLFYRAGEMHGVDDWIAVATAAVRQSSNQSDILKRLHEESGLAFRVIDGKTEGRYGYLGVVNTLPIDDALLFDIGGASSELMLMRDRELVDVCSIPYGALNLRVHFSHLPELEMGRAAQRFMLEELACVPFLSGAKGLPLVGLGGTARAVAKLHLARRRGSLERIHGYPLEAHAIQDLFAELSALPIGRRKKVKGLSESRADIVITGLATITALLDTLQSERMIVSRSGLREGIFFEHYLRFSHKTRLDNVLEHSVENFQKTFQVNRSVAQSVTAATMILFDRLVPSKLVSETDRTLLWVTAQIESCGCYVNTEKWAKHSAYLAQTSHLFGLDYDSLDDVVALLTGRDSSLRHPEKHGMEKHASEQNGASKRSDTTDHRLHRLSVLLRLAKLLNLQLGIPAQELYAEFQHEEFCVGKMPHIAHRVATSADAGLGDEFAKAFGIPLCYKDK